jgi:hypothetical protein
VIPDWGAAEAAPDVLLEVEALAVALAATCVRECAMTSGAEAAIAIALFASNFRRHDSPPQVIRCYMDAEQLLGRLKRTGRL